MLSIMILIHVPYLQNVAFSFKKRLKWSNSLLLKFPTPNKKTQQNIPSLPLGGLPPSLNVIWKTLNAVSKLNVTKKK